MSLACELRSYSTLHSLGFEWDLGGGDTNHNATCRVAYRRSDETTWHEALPLFRVDYFGWYADKPAKQGYNMLAGSILLFGDSGIRHGAGMRRGTIAFLGGKGPPLLPTFRRACRCIRLARARRVHANDHEEA